MAAPNETRRKISNIAPEEIPSPLTRSKTSPFNRDRCFFCDGSESCGKVLLLLLPSPYVQSFSNERDQLEERYDIDYVRLTAAYSWENS